MNTQVSIQFVIDCVSSYQGNCSLAGFPRLAYPMIYNLTSTDFCTKLVSDGSITASLISYSDSNYQSSNLNFLYSQRAYFGVDIQVLTGPEISNVQLLQVTIASQTQRTLAANDPLLIVNNNVPNAPNKCRFSFIFGDSVTQIINSDHPQTVVVTALLQINYKNNNQGLNINHPSKLMSAELFATDSKASTLASTSVFVTPNRASNANSNTNDGAFASASSIGFLIIAGAVGAIMLLVMFSVVLFIRNKRRIIQEKIANSQIHHFAVIESQLQSNSHSINSSEI